MSNEKSQTIFEFILSPQVTAITSAMGLLVLVLNLWIVSKLAPLASNIDNLEARADHTDATVLNFIPRAELVATFTPIQEDIKEIKQDVRDIKNLLTE